MTHQKHLSTNTITGLVFLLWLFIQFQNSLYGQIPTKIEPKYPKDIRLTHKTRAYRTPTIGPADPDLITDLALYNPNTKLIIFERLNRSGRRAEYFSDRETFTFPFLEQRTVSLMVKQGYVAYITFSGASEFGDVEMMFSGEYDSIPMLQSGINQIKKLRIVQAGFFFLNFKGFSLPIHDNDCRTVFGSIDVQLFEIAPDGTRIPCPVLRTGPYDDVYGTPALRNKKYNSKIFDWRGGTLPSWLTFVVNNFDGTPRSYEFNGTLRDRGTSFHVSAEAARDPARFLEVLVTPSLTFNHKSNWAAGDFSSNVSTRGRIVKVISSTQLAGNQFIVDGISIKGNPDNNHGMASGVEFSIVKEVRLIFTRSLNFNPPELREIYE